MGGDTNRHPQHYTVWGLVLTVLTAISAATLAVSSDWTLRGIGIASVAVALYIVASFFIPLALPPIWNERVVVARREAAKRSVLARLNEVRQGGPPRPPRPSPIVRQLARALAAQRAEESRLGVLPLATELRDIRRKIEKVKSMARPVYWDGFRLPGARWDEYHKALATRPELYKAVERAYVLANDVNEAVQHRRTVSEARRIGPNPTDGLDEAYEAAGEALDALNQPRGEPFETPTQKAAREIIEDERDASAGN
jgi:hypothetical protein